MSSATPARPRFSALALMLGNFVTGLAVLAPAGMLNDLTVAFGVTVQEAGWLLTAGAIVLCIGSPLMAWVTSAMDRRTLLTTTLALLAVGFVLSAVATSFAMLLVVRLLLLFVAAVFTPQAAGAIALITTEKERAGAISFVFLGWSLAVAAGLPLVTLAADQVGWRFAFGLLAGLAGLTSVLAGLTLPAGLRGGALSLGAWSKIAQNPQILLLLLLTALFIGGQFTIFAYLAPLLARLAGATPAAIAATFAGMGVLGLIGNAIASRSVRSVGAFRMSAICVSSMIAGAAVWTLGIGNLPAMALGVGLIGLGSFALNSMQQGRLVAAAPDLASGSVALNTSLLYVGQAAGSWLGGVLIARDMAVGIGYGTLFFMVASAAVLAATRR